MLCILRIEWRAQIHVTEHPILRSGHIPKPGKYAADICAAKIGWAMGDIGEWRHDF